MSWTRTVRFDDAQQHAIDALAAFEGVRSDISPHAFGRRYALARGGAGTDPSEVRQRVGAQWFDEVIVALAIEPQPADALPHLHDVLTGPGGVSGVHSAQIAGAVLLVECSAGATPSVVLGAVDCELRRWNGTRRTTLLAPLSDEVFAQIAAAGLHAPEITSARILETLLEAHVE